MVIKKVFDREGGRISVCVGVWFKAYNKPDMAVSFQWRIFTMGLMTHIDLSQAFLSLLINTLKWKIKLE